MHLCKRPSFVWSRIPFLLAAVLMIPTLACAPSGQESRKGLAVVSTVTQVSALARAVGGDRIALTALLTSRDDPHQYDLKPDQVTSLIGARVILLSGAGLDKWMNRGLQAAGAASRAVDLSASVKLRQSETEGTDPHWWYDTDNASAAVDRIAQVFGAADPTSAAVYQSNAASAKRQLADTDQQIHALIDPIPPAKRLFVANHDAFSYFLERYQITLVGDIVPSTDSIQAVRPADIAQLVSAIRAKRVCAIFTETTIDPKLAAQVAGEARVKVVAGKLFGDSIGDPGGPGGRLDQALIANARLMAEAFTSC